MSRQRSRHDERGAATVMVFAMVVVLGATALVLVTGAGLFVEHRRAQAAADLAALAGAAAVGGPGAGSGGSACSVAARTATRNGAELTSCEVLGRDVRVRVAIRRGYAGGLTAVVEGAARAGPAGSSAGSGSGAESGAESGADGSGA